MSEVSIDKIHFNRDECDFRSYFASVLTVILHTQFRNPAVFVKR